MLYDFQQFDNERHTPTLEIHQADGALEMHQVAVGTYLFIAPAFVQKDLILSIANISLQQGPRLMLVYID